MNKTELITYLRNPTKLSGDQLDKLEGIVDDYPYFLSARLLLAKASKEQDHAKTKKRIASAAIYSTDRVLLKKYLSGDLFFLSQQATPEVSPKTGAKKTDEEPKKEHHPKATPVTESKKTEAVKPESKQPEKPKPEEKAKAEPVSKEVQPAAKGPAIAAPTKSAEDTSRKTEDTPRKDVRPSSLKNKEEKPQPEIPDLPGGELDSILEELQRDMENLKSSREKFAAVQQQIEEDDAVSAALEKVSSKPTKPEPAKPEEKIEEGESDPGAKPDKPEELASDKAEEDAIEKIKAEVKKEETDKTEAKEQIKDTEPKESTDDDNENARAERVIREPRFSRFSTRSYLKPPGEADSSKLPEDKKTSEVDEKKKEEPADTKSGGEDKIKLPDLSKAKPVARKNPRKKKKEEPKAEKKVKEGESEKTKKETGAEKKEAKKTTKKKATKTTSEKKTTGKKSTSKKEKEPTKKGTRAKSSSENKSKDKKEEKKDDDKADRKDQQDIIDKFIKESPTIKYQRKEETKTEDLAEQSAEWDPNLASEYLAEIYLHQGNKKRAIEIYEALSLKYPEKKSYFADLISKIE